MDGEKWIFAIDGNSGNNATTEQLGFQGSFSLFQNGDGSGFEGYGDDISQYIGAWGIDLGDGKISVWAVLNHNSEFAVIPEPEIGTLLSLGLGLGFLAALLRRKKARVVQAIL